MPVLVLPALLLILLAPAATAADECESLIDQPITGHAVFEALRPSAAEQLQGMRIRSVETARLEIFDLDDPAEDIWLYRLANRLHIVSRDQAIREQLQFGEGDRYRQELMHESERILRERRWLFDARVVPVRRCNDEVDVQVVTRDVWSLTPTGDLDRSGGDTSLAIGIQEENLLGRGERLGVIYTDDEDRSGVGIFFIDDYFLGGPGSMLLTGAKNSDGGNLFLDLKRPFRNLDERLSYGIEVDLDQRDRPLFREGSRVARFEQRRIRTRAFAASSSGRQDGVIERWTIGLEFEDVSFDRTDGPLQPARIADDRRRTWPFVRFESIEDNWDASARLDFLQRPQDVYLGLRYGVTLGWAPDILGADADRIMIEADIRNSFRPTPQWIINGRANLDGAIRGTSSENLLLSVGAEAHFRHHEVFGFFASLDGTLASNLTEDRQLQLGGENGLRGYPFAFQQGDRRLRLRLEERYFSTAHPFRMFMIGGAVFLDAGRAWFSGDPDDATSGWLANVGVGLRVGTTRGVSESLFHIDVAFPLRRGGPDVDDVLLGLTARRGF